jgi:hypothetical protein
VRLLHQAAPDVVLRLEITELRRENARLHDELTSLRRELDAARAAVLTQHVDIDYLLDLADTYTLTDSAERLFAKAGDRYRWGCHDTRSLTTDQAHTVMQQHRRCLTGQCPIRTTAVRMLRDAGHLSPDSTRPGLLAHL